MITLVKLKNFKAFEEQSFQFEPKNEMEAMLPIASLAVGCSMLISQPDFLFLRLP